MSSWRHIRATMLLPGMVLVVVPSVILVVTDHGKGLAEWSRFSRLLLALVGLALVAVGLMLVISSLRLFPRVGLGTLAPWDETRRLVVVGPYRYVRNPMITGVLIVLLGESVAAHSWALLGWTGIFLLVNLIYIPLFEERGLTRRFGDEYREYAGSVPRWVPRRTPWEPDVPEKSG